MYQAWAEVLNDMSRQCTQFPFLMKLYILVGKTNINKNMKDIILDKDKNKKSVWEGR